jgi:ATP-dependent Clp endopeptidase proteolytic subunit ClpP
MSGSPKNFEDLTSSPSLDNVLVGLSREGVSVKQRKIYIPSVSIESPLILSEFLDYIIEFGDKEKINDPVNLIIGTYGGESYGMFGMVDIIRNAPMPIDTTAIGAAFSAGAWVLAAGTGTRRAYENAYIMIHQLRGGQDGTMHEMAQTTAHYKHMQKLSEKLLAQFTNKDEKYWNRVCKKEHYITAEQALEVGVIDEIIYEKAKNV